jgi:hypothetical protein
MSHDLHVAARRGPAANVLHRADLLSGMVFLREILHAQRDHSIADFAAKRNDDALFPGSRLAYGEDLVIPRPDLPFGNVLSPARLLI